MEDIMSELDLNKIREIASGHTIEPRAEVWDRLDNKLKAKKNKQKLFLYRNLSIAAIFLSVVSVTIVFSLYVNQHNPEIFASNEQYRPIMIEELEAVDDDPFFNVSNVKKAHEDFIDFPDLSKLRY